MKLFLLIICYLFSSTLIAKSYQIKMLNKDGRESMLFKPSILKLMPGDTVNFIPESIDHNTTSVFLPEQVDSWRSETGQPFQLQLEKEGLYIYECTNHKAMGMFGIIQVGDKFNEEDTRKFLNEYKKKVFINKKRVENYLTEIINKNL